MPPRSPGRRPSGSLQRFLGAQRVQATCFAEWCAPPAQPVQEWVRGAMEAFARRHRRSGAEGWTLVFWQELLRRLPSAEDGDDDWDEATAATLDWAQAIRALPLSMRQVFLLRVWVGFDIGHCARLMGCTDSVAKSRLYHALQRVSLSFGGGGGPAEGWLMRCRAHLDEHAAERTPALLRASEDGYQAALDVARPARFLPWQRLVVVAVTIVVAAAVALLWLRPDAGQSDDEGRAELEQPLRISAEPIEQLLSLPPEDFALLADPAEFELLAELEFYRWLEREMPDAP
jgi:DNA-directed RNA polymerase specialized sigma24 family protein